MYVFSFNLRLLPQVNTSSHAISPIIPTGVVTYAKYIMPVFPAFLERQFYTLYIPDSILITLSGL